MVWDEVDIRYLKQGLVRVFAPPQFKTWTAKSKMKWARTRLKHCSETQIMFGLSDFDLRAGEEPNFIMETPSVMAIQTTEGEDIVITKGWEDYWQNIKKPEIIGEENK